MRSNNIKKTVKYSKGMPNLLLQSHIAKILNNSSIDDFDENDIIVIYPNDEQAIKVRILCDFNLKKLKGHIESFDDVITSEKKKYLKRFSPARNTDFSKEEENILKKGGFILDQVSSDTVEASASEYIDILRQSLSSEQTAALLKVNSSRIRQRLVKEKSLYGIKLKNTWKVPKFQFYKNQEVPGINQVMPKINRELHPLTVIEWFNTPNLNLIPKGNSSALSPLDWLKLYDSLVVAELAGDL